QIADPAAAVMWPRQPGRPRLSPGCPRLSPGCPRVSPGRLRVSPGRLRLSPGRLRLSPGRLCQAPGLLRATRASATRTLWWRIPISADTLGAGRTLIRHACDDGGRGETAVRRLLLLNVTYEPPTTVGLRRAVCLVLCEKAEIVPDDLGGKMLCSASISLAPPSVIRLRRYVRVPYRNRVPLTRAALMRRDNYLCGYCGHRAETVDHVVPRSRGGGHTWENCVASCRTCNHR